MVLKNVLLDKICRLLEFLFPSLDCENVEGYHIKCMPYLYKNLKF